MTWCVLAQPGWARPDGKSVVVYGLLVQDLVPAGTPNRAFWSIAVEVQLYVLLPLLLLLVRRVSAIVMVALVTAVVMTVGVLGAASGGHERRPGHADARAGRAVRDRRAGRRHRLGGRPHPLAPLGLAGPGGVGSRRHADRRPGSVWTITHLFWVDLAWGPAIGCLLAAVATARPRRLIGVLDAWPLRRLGRVLLQPVPHPRAHRDRRRVRAGARPGRRRDTDVPRALRDPAARDGGLRSRVRGRVRDPVPTPPGRPRLSATRRDVRPASTAAGLVRSPVPSPGRVGRRGRPAPG